VNHLVSKLDDVFVRLVGFTQLNSMKHHKGTELALRLPGHFREHFLEEFFGHIARNAHDM
jgi:hypothetical protein